VPASAPTSSPRFERTEGITRERVLEVCAHVVCNRAHEIASLELHQMRTNDKGGSPTRVREVDGAIAWRVSLQVKSNSARRLHFWVLPTGRIELSKIGVHDDITIV